MQNSWRFSQVGPGLLLTLPLESETHCQFFLQFFYPRLDTKVRLQCGLDCTTLWDNGLLLHRKKLQIRNNIINTAQGVFCALPMTPFWFHLLCRMVRLFFRGCSPTRLSWELWSFLLVSMVLIGVFLAVEGGCIYTVFPKGLCWYLNAACCCVSASGNWSCPSLLTERMQI